MAKKEQKLIKARHNEHGGTQLFPESHWRLVDKKVWTEIVEKQAAPTLPEVAADIQKRAKEHAEPDVQQKKAGRPPKPESL